MWSSRQGATIDHVLDHHQAGTDSEAVARAMTSGSRQVSANYIITNEGDIWGVVAEGRRAWTSGSTSDGGRGAAWDRRSITVEVENDVNGEPWTRSPAAMAACSRLYADVAKEYGFSLSYDDRGGGTVLRHRDLSEFHGASYPTRCNGTVDMAAIVAAAKNPASKGTNEVTVYIPTTSWKNAPKARILSDLRSKELVTDSTRIALLDYLGPSAVNGPGVTAIGEATWNQLLALPNFPTGAGGINDLAPVLQAIAAGEAQDLAAQAQLLTVINGVDEATLATFGLKRA